MWRRVIPLLRGDHRLVLPDMRGLGWSGWPADGDFAKERLADDALAILDALGLARAHLLTHDWGAWTGMLLALRSPERVRSLLALGIVHPWQPRPVMARNAWRFAYQLPLAAPVLGELLIRRGRLTHAMLRGAWGDRSTWDERGGRRCSSRAAGARPRPAPASRLYRTFLTRELPAIGAGAFAGRRLAVPSRLVIGSRDPLGAELAHGLRAPRRRRGRRGARRLRALRPRGAPGRGRRARPRAVRRDGLSRGRQAAAVAALRSRASSRVMAVLPHFVASA